MNLTKRQLDVLNHVLVDGQEWADNAKKEAHVIAKVAKYESAYDEAVAKGNYQTRKQRDDEQVRLEQERYDNVSWDVKRQREYPTISELVVALYDTGDKAEIDKRRAEIKAKYPKENS
jgi:hypothetical protein